MSIVVCIGCSVVAVDRQLVEVAAVDKQLEVVVVVDRHIAVEVAAADKQLEVVVVDKQLGAAFDRQPVAGLEVAVDRQPVAENSPVFLAEIALYHFVFVLELLCGFRFCSSYSDNLPHTS